MRKIFSIFVCMMVIGLTFMSCTPTTGSDNGSDNRAIDGEALLGSVESRSSNGGELTCYNYEGYRILLPTCIGQEIVSVSTNGAFRICTKSDDFVLGYIDMPHNTIWGLYIDIDSGNYMSIVNNCINMGNDMLNEYCPHSDGATIVIAGTTYTIGRM